MQKLKYALKLVGFSLILAIGVTLTIVVLWAGR